MINDILLLLILLLLSINVYLAEKRSFIDEDGVEIEIIKKIGESKCKIKSQFGDHIEQYFKLTTDDGFVIGSNFGHKPYAYLTK